MLDGGVLQTLQLAWQVAVGLIAGGAFMYGASLRAALRKEALERRAELSEFQVEREKERAADASKRHDLENRLIAAETRLDALPTQAIIAEMGREMAGVKTDVGKIAGTLEAMQPAVQMINEYLMRAGKGTS